MGDATTRRPMRLVPVLLASMALVAGCAGPAPSVPAGTTAAPGSSEPPVVWIEPPASAGPTPTATSPRPDGWARVDLPELPLPATLEPLTAGVGAVSPETSFRLRSLDGRPPAELAKALVADPALAFDVVSVQGDTAILRPAAGLEPGASYRIWLPRADGTTAASWVAQAASPLRLTDAVPGDAATAVPRDTGIEVTFDQYGVTAADFARFFTIRPAVEGRFEVLGRTIAFLPDQPLAKGRLYTVTVGRGLPLPGTGEILEHDVIIRFETAGAAAKTSSPIRAAFRRALVEAPTSEAARISVGLDVPEGRTAPRSIPITVHRVEGLTAAVAAWRAIVEAPEWTRVSAAEPVPTAGLERVFSGKVRLRTLDDWGTRWFAVPVKLPAGWYVVTERWAGIPRQVLLQVSDLATFAMVAEDRSAVWVNNLRTGKPVAGATAVLGGETLGQTDDRGLLVAATPSAVAEGGGVGSVLLVVRDGGRSAFRPTGLGDEGGGSSVGEAPFDGGAWYEGDLGWGGWASGDDEWWRLLYTDRTTYRSTDTVNAWGMARNRDTGRVPTSVTLTVRVSDDDGTVGPPLAIAAARPDANGAFAVRLPLRDLPFGACVLELVVEDHSIGEAWLEVGPITKPAWQLDLSTDRRAVISGGRVTTTVRAWFYEGTPVTGASISLYRDDEDAAALVRTDAFGRARRAFVLTAGGDCQPCSVEIAATPDDPWESDPWASASVDVFAASAVVDAAATLTGTRLRVTGKVSDVVLSRYAQATDDEDVDPRGPARAAADVRVRVVEQWTVEQQVGTEYDAITKQVVPVYDTVDRQRTVADRTVITSSRGTFSLALDVRGGRRSYTITAAYVDEEGRRTATETWASVPTTGSEAEEESSGDQPELVDAGTDPGEDGYAVGETVRVRFRGVVAKPSVERYLYAIAQRGLRYVTVGTTPTFRTTFDRSLLPGFWITGVRFNGSGYEAAVSGYEASTALDTRQLSVTVTPDRDRYAPGDMAVVGIRTLGPDGRPVSASVYVKAIDEKLYAIDAAFEDAPLSDLYGSVGDGILAAVTSHRPVEDDVVDCCDTTGGGDERTDFRDWLIATLVTTNRAGRATVRVPLSDDLTSWRVSASAIDGSLQAGDGRGRLVVGLPFFTEATLKDEYLAADRPVLGLRAFGAALGASDRVTFTVSSDTLPMAPVTVRAKAFDAAEVALPGLTAGTHRVRIEARAGTGRSDTLVRTFRVVESRAVRRTTTWAALSGPTGVDAGANTTFTDLTLVDGGRGRVIPALQDLAWADDIRADQQLAAALANHVLTDDLGLEAASPAGDASLERFWRKGGIALVAQGSSQLEVTVLAALTGDPRLDEEHLRDVLRRVTFDPAERRDRRLLALAGLAGLGEPVAGEIRSAAAVGDLTLAEQVTLALAALYGGDEMLAGGLERGVLESNGLAYGPWLRIDTGDAEVDALLTARLAIVAASLGEPFAADMDAWLAANPPRTTVVDLERALAARGWVRRAAGTAAVANVTIDGFRQQLRLPPGAPISLRLTPAQAATARLEPVSGSVLVVTSREVPLEPDDLTAPSGATMTRSVKPSGRIGPTDTVVVTLKVTLPKAARAEDWTVVDWVPSGLTAGSDTWGVGDARGVTWPDLVEGQRVEFHIGGSPKTGTWILRYVARVVTAGRYRWDSAVLQSDIAPDHGIVLPPATVTIEGPGAVASGPAATPRPVPTPSPTAPPQPTPVALPSPAPTPTPTPTAPPTPVPTPTVTPTPTATPGPIEAPALAPTPAPTAAPVP